MSAEALKCSQIVRQISLDRFRLPKDGRKWRQAARGRQNLLFRLSSYANGDGTFERDGQDYSPSEKTIVKHVGRGTYYRNSNALKELGWLSWTRRQNHYNRRTFTIHLLNEYVPDSPKTRPTFSEKHVPDSPKNTSHIHEKTGLTFARTRPTMGPDNTSHHGNYPSYPNTLVCASADCRSSDTSEIEHEHDDSSGNSLSDADTASLVEFSIADPTEFFSRSEENPFRPTKPIGKGGEEESDSREKCEVGPEPMDAATKRRIQKDYAISKTAEWRDVPKEVQAQVKALIQRCALEWEYVATHEDDDLIADEDRTISQFPHPSAAYLIQFSRLLRTYTESQILRAFRKFVHRPQGLEGLYAPWAVFLGENHNEFDIYVEDAASKESACEQARLVQGQPSIEAVVAALDAEDHGAGWIAQCPFPENHSHGDSNPSLAISQNEDGKILVRCRGGCDQRSVWSRVVELASKVAVEDLPKLAPKITTPKVFTATQDDVAKLHAHLNTVPAVQAWLNEWGITTAVADKLQLGAWDDVSFKRRDGTYFRSSALYIPHYDLTGKLIGLKMRAVSEKAFVQVDGSSTAGLFAAAHLDPRADEVLVFEGDKDVAIALSHGFNATGILSANSNISDDDLILLARYKRICLIGDQDVDGIRVMDSLAKRLPPSHVLRVHIPAKDVGELFQQDSLCFKDRLSDIVVNTMTGIEARRISRKGP